ncbi:hypothetical protein Cgig2_032451 [Carnegiea gigantea]|uniref:K Homology domain-containing protein n=1 Tax=Carnegiea gigantea TaxID=171969 RepID=A0A9Q1QRC1_9CARY|nr:hypothetical protein Cgig2_032451 [Carnegiea gigantea]
MERGVSEANGGGGKRKIDDEIELAKQKAQAIAARFLNDADAKRPRTGFDSAPPPSSFSSSQPSFPVSYATQTSQYNGVPSSKKIVIPNAKVGVIIGRGGDMIKNLQQRSGARIQITRDADADPTSLTRDVELVGTQEQISRAEELINEVIAETDATSSVSSGNRGGAPLQPGSEQFVMKVPNDKVALVIGKGGETIKSMQNKSGARIQPFNQAATGSKQSNKKHIAAAISNPGGDSNLVVPLHLPPGDTSTERNVFINGTKEQIEAGKELVNEVINGNRLKVLSGTNTYNQSTYAPGTGWAPQGQPPAQQPPAYGYTQPGGYAMPPPPPPYYGGYPSQPSGWEQQTNPAAAPTQQQNTGFNAYGQNQPTSTPPNVNYNYSHMPQATGYSYNQGYAQQPPSYGQDVSGQAQTPDQAKSYANPAYGPQATSSQPDGTPPVQTSQPGYATPALQAPQPGYGTPTAQSSQPGYGTAGAQSSQPGYGTPAASDGTTQSQPPSTYATGYGQPAAAPSNGYAAYPSYSTPPSVQPAYSQSGYSQMAYGQQQEGQVSNQASYSYYGQGGYPPTQAPVQSGYYQGAYPQAPPPQAPPQTKAQGTNGVPQSGSYGAERADRGDPTTGSDGAAAAEESENPQS